ncbi:hypothetical protein B0H16DRAFT_1467478 [Mycena metata]|uniref:Uncharacterized protein n=1 Tax=Mycena metata TaxID=1033252 RepID=A0AAD7I435_9AGAR|nr:hypothetical protein B0H16DRAFT_1467478 [Mycena metata]
MRLIFACGLAPSVSAVIKAVGVKGPSGRIFYHEFRGNGWAGTPTSGIVMGARGGMWWHMMAPWLPPSRRADVGDRDGCTGRDVAAHDGALARAVEACRRQASRWARWAGRGGARWRFG